MTELTEEQLNRIAILERRAAPLMAHIEALAALETQATSSGKVYSPTLLQDARYDLRRAILSARLAIENPEPQGTV